jgi:hypothetical protein
MRFDTVEDSLQYLDGFTCGHLHPLDVYEFGVFNGNTLGRLIKGFREKKIEVGHFWGFDSFEGLPKEDSRVWHNPEWPEHAFNVQKDFGLHSVDEAVAFVYNNLNQVNLDDNVTLIPGYFEDTCNGKTWSDMKMYFAHYIHIDADIYISSYQALDFCFDHWIPVNGTFIRFDDMMSTPRNAGQHLAWTKIKAKYNVVAEQYSYNVFRVLSYDMMEGD